MGPATRWECGPGTRPATSRPPPPSRCSTSACGGGTGTANLWVDTSGGTCARSATPVAYSDASACSSFDAAWDAASAGDTIRVKAGTYGPQTISGARSSETRILAESGTKIGKLAATTANFLTVENLIVDVGSVHGSGNAGQFGASNVTLRDVSFHGTYVSIEVGGDNFTWQRGSLGQDGTTGGVRTCAAGDNQPVWLDGDNATFDGVRWNPQRASLNDPTCGSDNSFHMESLRVQGARNTTVRNSWFLAGSDVGSGHIFITTTSPQAEQPTGFRLENTVLEPVNGSYVLQQHANVQSCATYVLAYNTFHQDLLWSCGTTTGMQWIGNLGPKSDLDCDGTYVKNVWQNDTNSACGSDKWVAGPRWGTGNLGINADRQHLNAGSPAIDAGEAPAASDYCTGALGSADRDGQTRPAGSACDAGADERN